MVDGPFDALLMITAGILALEWSIPFVAGVIVAIVVDRRHFRRYLKFLAIALVIVAVAAHYVTYRCNMGDFLCDYIPSFILK